METKENLVKPVIKSEEKVTQDDITKTIEKMQEVMKLDFVKNGKEILRNAKVIKGVKKYNTFNKELDEFTYEMEEIYPIDYDKFEEEFPAIVENVKRVPGASSIKMVDDGTVIQGWSVRTNVDAIIENAKERLDDGDISETDYEKAVDLANRTYEDCQRLKSEYGIDWCQDMFWKCYAIKEGRARWNYLVKTKGAQVAQKKIDAIQKQGGLVFIEELNNIIYPDNK